MWCVPALDAEYIAKMEDVLNVLARPHDSRAPVVALDERPVLLRGAARPWRPMAPGHLGRVDYEYVRHGTANVYCIGHAFLTTMPSQAPTIATELQP